jgi:hypothetical protein
MSTTAVGITLDLDGPLPVAREFSLLANPEVVKPDDGRWLNGVRVAGYPAGVPSRFEPCSTGTFRVKDEDVGDSFPGDRFDPIAVYFPVSCSTHGMSDSAIQRLVDKTEAVLDATLSFGVEESLAKGTSLSPNPYLGDSSMTAPAGNTAVSPSVGIAYLENAIGATGRAGVIHATPAVVAALGFNFLREEDPDGTDDSGDEELETANGTCVISGAGYIGTSPSGRPAPSTTKDWVFATGPVEVRLEGGPRVELVESIDRSSNDLVIRAERFVLVEWDTVLQAGVLIDWSL